MNCQKCNQTVNQKEVIYQDSLPPGVGYASPTVVRCNCCKKIICEKCYYGWGGFRFTCENEQCKKAIK